MSVGEQGVMTRTFEGDLLRVMIVKEFQAYRRGFYEDFAAIRPVERVDVDQALIRGFDR